MSDYLDQIIKEQADYYGMTVEDYERRFIVLCAIQEHMEMIEHERREDRAGRTIRHAIPNSLIQAP